MRSPVLAIILSVLTSTIYVLLMGMLSTQAKAALAGAVLTWDNQLTNVQELHLPWYLYAAMAIATAGLFLLLSWRRLFPAGVVRRVAGAAAALTAATILIIGAMRHVPLRLAGPVRGVDGWVQQAAESPAVYSSSR